MCLFAAYISPPLTAKHGAQTSPRRPTHWWFSGESSAAEWQASAIVRRWLARKPLTGLKGLGRFGEIEATGAHDDPRWTSRLIARHPTMQRMTAPMAGPRPDRLIERTGRQVRG
jgi:hypothetical protein